MNVSSVVYEQAEQSLVNRPAKASEDIRPRCCSYATNTYFTKKYIKYVTQPPKMLLLLFFFLQCRGIPLTKIYKSIISDGQRVYEKETDRLKE